MRCVVGLGNPGGEYQGTRHNLGFALVDALAAQLRGRWVGRSGAEVVDGSGAPRPFVLVKPMTYMNRSGPPLRQAMTEFGLEPADLLVAVDDFHLDLGRLRVRRAGSDGGHNGLKSLIGALGTQDFARLRLGIGPPAEGMAVEDYVLGRFKSAERDEARELVDRGVEVALDWIQGQDIDALMNRYNAAAP